MPFEIDRLKDVHTSPVSAIEIKRRANDAELVFTCSDEELKVTNLATRQHDRLYKVSDAAKEELNCVKLLPTNADEARYLFASNSQHLFLFDLEKLKVATKFKFNKDTISCLELNKAGNCLACGDDSGEIKLLDIRAPPSSSSGAGSLSAITLNRNLTAHTNICYALKFNPANEFELFSAGFDCSVIKWDMRSAKRAAKQHAFVEQINVSAALTAATCGDSEQNSDAFVSSMTPCFVHCLEFNSVGDSTVLMAGVESGMCMLFDAKTCKSVGHRQIQPFNCALTQLCPVQMTDGQEPVVVAAAGNGTHIEFVAVKSEENAEEAGTFQMEDVSGLRLNHGNKVNCLKFSDKKLFVADTTNDLTIYKHST